MITRINYCLFILLFLLFTLIPSVDVEQLMDSSQTGKSFVFAYALLLVVTLHLIKWLLLTRINQCSGQIKPIDILLAAMIFYISVNRYLLQPVDSFSLRYYELIGLALLYVVLRKLDWKYYPSLFLAVIVSGLIQAIYGNMQLLGHYSSNNVNYMMTGSFFNPGPYAGFLATVFPVALGILCFRKQLVTIPTKSIFLSPEFDNNLNAFLFYYIPCVAIAFILCVLPGSSSRASWLAIVISSTFLLSAKFQLKSFLGIHFTSRLRKCILLLGVTILVCFLFFKIYLLKKDSADGRLLIWRISAVMAMDRPLVGFGFDQFKAHYMNYQADYFKNHNIRKDEALIADNITYAFNEPLQFLIENGVLGVAFLVLISLNIIYVKAIGNCRWLIIAKATLFSTAVFSFYSYPSQILPIKIVVVLMLATVAARSDQVWARKSFYFSISYPQIIPVRIAIVLIVFSIALFASSQVTNSMRAFWKWKEGYELYLSGRYAQSADTYDEVAADFKDNGEFLMSYGKALSMAGKHEKAIEILKSAKRHLANTVIFETLGNSYKELKNFQGAEEHYWRAWYMAPRRFYPKYLLVMLYRDTNQRSKAVAIAKQLLTSEIKIESTAIMEIQNELKRISDGRSLESN